MLKESSPLSSFSAFCCRFAPSPRTDLILPSHKPDLMKIRSIIPLALAVLFSPTFVQSKPTQPNILFIFADDMSYEARGAVEMLDIDTPHLDRLAERGVNFTHAYNMGGWNGAICVASRTMMNTGKTIWTARTANLDAYVGENRFWSQRMSQVGYQTYMTGKWHVKAEVPEIFDV